MGLEALAAIRALHCAELNALRAAGLAGGQAAVDDGLETVLCIDAPRIARRCVTLEWLLAWKGPNAVS